MIDLTKGPVHISSGPGSNPNSMCLTLISEALKQGGRVIWMVRKFPNREKVSDILGHLSEKEMGRMMIIEFEEKLLLDSSKIKKIIPSLRKEDLLVIEEWCESFGRSRKKEGDFMRDLAKINEKLQIVITSNSYEDASGEKRGLDGWMVRGEKLLGNAYRTVWMTKIQDQYQKVIITDGNSQNLVHLTKNGFENYN